jgi:hypothetical protein
MRGVWTVLAALLPLTASCAHPIAGMVARPVVTPSPKPVAALSVDPWVGAVFVGGKSLHACTGSVLDSPSGDLILTAAHCVANGMEAFFVPGYDQQAPDEAYWKIDAVYLDSRWMTAQDPLADFAIARVSQTDGGSLESKTGGGFALGEAPRDGTEVRVAGYPLGVGGGQLDCRGRTGELKGYPSLPCEGFVDGTSGGPWIANSTVTGVIGGLDGGGCQENVSYSPPFDGAVKQLLARAEAGGPSDAAPVAIATEC